MSVAFFFVASTPFELEVERAAGSWILTISPLPPSLLLHQKTTRALSSTTLNPPPSRSPPDVSKQELRRRYDLSLLSPLLQLRPTSPLLPPHKIQHLLITLSYPTGYRWIQPTHRTERRRLPTRGGGRGGSLVRSPVDRSRSSSFGGGGSGRG